MAGRVPSRLATPEAVTSVLDAFFGLEETDVLRTIAPTRPCKLLVVETEAEIVGAFLQKNGEVTFADGSRLAYFGSFFDSMDATFHVFEKYPGPPPPVAPLTIMDEPWPEDDRSC